MKKNTDVMIEGLAEARGIIEKARGKLDENSKGIDELQYIHDEVERLNFQYNGLVSEIKHRSYGIDRDISRVVEILGSPELRKLREEYHKIPNKKERTISRSPPLKRGQKTAKIEG